MHKGRVKWFSPEKGYGFILTDPDTEVFVHHTQIECDGFCMLHAGEHVEFELVDTSRGWQARHVRRLGFDRPADSEPDTQPPAARSG